MSDRGGRLADGLLSRVNDVDATIAPLDDARWALRCGAEGWSIGFVTYHLGLGFERQAGWLEQHARGGPPHDFSWDETNALNARSVAQLGLPSKEDARRFLRDAAQRFVAAVRRLTDQQLDAIAYTYRGKSFSAEWVVAVLAMRHIEDHLRSIEATLATRVSP